jgi:hypothetical protein
MNRPCEPLAVGRWDSDLVWPAAINCGGSEFAFPPTHGLFPIDSMFSFCSHSTHRGSPDVNVSERSQKIGGRDRSPA